MAAPTNQEQLLLEFINETRLDPLGSAARYLTSYNPLTSSDPDIQFALSYFGVSGSALLSAFSALTPTQPLAWNNLLADAARGHSELMITYDQQSHQLPGEPSFGTRISNAGYSYSLAGENVYAYAKSELYAHAGFMVDWGSGPDGMQSPPGHRNNLMNPTFREVGIGIIAESNPSTSVGPLVVTEDLAVRQNSPQVFLLGVAYTDGNGNGFYSVGEGRSGMTVNASGISGLTTSSGGYVLELLAGSKTITFSGGGLATPLVVSASLSSGTNAKLDVVDAASIKTSVSLTVVSGVTKVSALGTTNLNLTGSSGNEILNGNSGNNLLQGLAGADVLNGGSGNDTLEGGEGPDTLVGGTGADLLVGGAGDDWFYGEGADSINGGDGNDVLFGGQGGALNLNLATASLETVWGSVVGDILDGSGATANLVLIGQGGADTMTGGSGNDFLYFDHLDSISGGSGTDWAVASLSSVGVSLNLAATGFETAWGSPYADTLSAAGSAATVVLVGDSGNDTLTGGNATDYLYGFGGNDVLTGGPGGDLLVGDIGNDQFVYASRTGSGFDSIFGFTSGADQFRMTASEYGMVVGGSLSAGSSFIAGASLVATSAIPTFLYYTASGILTFDLDGSGGTYSSVSIAQLFAAPALAASDFAFV